MKYFIGTIVFKTSGDANTELNNNNSSLHYINHMTTETIWIFITL